MGRDKTKRSAIVINKFNEIRLQHNFCHNFPLNGNADDESNGTCWWQIQNVTLRRIPTKIEQKYRSNDIDEFFINILFKMDFDLIRVHFPCFPNKSFGNSLSNKYQNIRIFPHVTQIRGISKNMHSFLSIISCVIKVIGNYRIGLFWQNHEFQTTKTLSLPLPLQTACHRFWDQSEYNTA